MTKKKKSISSKLQIWIEARKKYRLTHTQIQMARELGLNPKKFGGYANHRQQPWKRPLGEYIEHIYFKRFKKNKPDALSIEEQAEEIRRKQAKKKERKRLKRAAEIEPPPGDAGNQKDAN